MDERLTEYGAQKISQINPIEIEPIEMGMRFRFDSTLNINPPPPLSTPISKNGRTAQVLLFRKLD